MIIMDVGRYRVASMYWAVTYSPFWSAERRGFSADDHRLHLFVLGFGNDPLLQQMVVVEIEPHFLYKMPALLLADR